MADEDAIDDDDDDADDDEDDDDDAVFFFFVTKADAWIIVHKMKIMRKR